MEDDEAGYEYEQDEAAFDQEDHARRGDETATRVGDERASDPHVLTARQIVVRAERDGEMPGEWTMIELQGAIETGSTAMPGLELGELKILPGDKAQLRIGRQLLDGTLVALKKPQAVLSKEPVVEGEPIRYTVIGVIRRKVQFTTRPNPIIPLAGNGGGGSGQTT